MVYFLILASFLAAAFLFALVYKKFKLPRKCFFVETPIIGCLSSLLVISSGIYNDNFYLMLLKFLAILFFSFVITVLWSFFRDPRRKFSGAQNVVISPADGRILYIRKVNKGIIPIAIKNKNNIPLNEIAKTDLFNQDCIIIGIVMSILDVHVNRSPIDGEVVLQKHTEGKFLSLKDPESDTQNERNVIVIKKGDSLVSVIQIASRVVRRILSFVNEGSNVKRGDKIGRILFGSQVDVIVPATAEILITEGRQVYAGLTPIAKIG